jgi:SAM-dependent methyltransferase
MSRKVERPGPREGYDLWSERYDATPNPVVALDRRVTPRAIAPRPGEWILDAGCGTGSHLAWLGAARARTVGLDFSRGMLRIARRAVPRAFLVQADLNRGFPIRSACFDVVLSVLVSEHLKDLRRFFSECYSALRRGGRLVFSAFHPDLARAGVEANFERDGTEYRLGAEPYSVDEYLTRISEAGFRHLEWREHRADERLAGEAPAASKYLGKPLLLVVRADS